MDTRPTFTRADLVKTDPWDVRTGDLIAQATADRDRFVGHLVLSNHRTATESQWIEFDAGHWQGHCDQPDCIPVWIVRRTTER